MKTIFPTMSLIIAFAFAAISLLLYPLWEDVNKFLSTSFPVMLSAAILGGVYFAALLYFQETKTFGQRWHYVLFSIVNVIMIGLLAYLLYELGTERTVLLRQFVAWLPHMLWFGAIIIYLWFMPGWDLLRSRAVIAGFVIALAATAIFWFNLPLTFKLTSRPVALIQDGGVVVAWGTNMTATGEIEYSVDSQLAQTVPNQTFGLKYLGDGIARVFLPLSPDTVSLSFTATSEGIRAVQPTSVKKAGTASSENITIPFPKIGDEISFVSFSDIHEQADIYTSLAVHVNWDEMDLAIYNGDLLNSTASPEQVTRSILGLPTGGRDLPRLFVRGNHETRNATARSLDDWLLPNGGHWYQSFTMGNTFFIVLDCGEDKLDTDKEYGGLVDFTSYQKEQASWLKEVLALQEFQAARYRIVLLHIPIFGVDQSPPPFEPVATLLRDNKDIDLMIDGHTHVYGIYLPEETGFPYPVAISGGPETDTAAAVLVETRNDSLRVKLIDVNGNVIEQLP